MTALRTIPPETLNEWLAQGRAVPVDVREPAEFAGGCIDGARPLPLSRFDPGAVPPSVGTRPVLYCRTGIRSEEAARRLLAAGAPEAWHLEGGLRAWKAAGLPVENAARVPISIMRQVQMVAGSLVLVGLGLGLLVSPWFLALCAVVGAGLFVAGAIDSCAMARMLAFMPWNRRRPD